MIDRPRITAVVGAALSITLAIAATAEEPAQPDLLQGFRMDPPWAVPLERPASHDTVWLGTHGAAATLGEAECVSCHDETACVDCHAGAGAAGCSRTAAARLPRARHAARATPPPGSAVLVTCRSGWAQSPATDRRRR